MFHNEEPQVFSVTVQNRVARNLCTPTVLMCLELLSKRTEIFNIKITKLGLERISLHSCSKRKSSEVSPFYTYSQFIDNHRKWCISSIKVFFFQLATGGIERAVYKKLIAPFKNDLPTSHIDGFGRVCADHKYAFFGPNILKTQIGSLLPCQLVPLPDTYYRDQWAFIISKNSSYKGLISWRWGN